MSDWLVQGGLTNRMKKEESRDKKFDSMWTELYVVCKGLAVLEDRYALPLSSPSAGRRAGQYKKVPFEWEMVTDMM